MRYVFTVLTIFAFTPAFAQQGYTTSTMPPQPSPVIDSVGGGAIPALPLKVHTTENGIDYINGGVGDEEEAQLKSTAGEYNLQLMLSGKSGAYISDIAIRVSDTGGNVLLSVDNAGPYLYAKLPAGTYIIEAMPKQENAVKRVKAKIPASGAYKQHFVFNDFNQ